MVIHRFPAFRQIAVQSGADIRGIRLIPPHDHLGEALGPWLPSGCGNAAVLDELMRIAHQVLDHHPFNEERRRNGNCPPTASGSGPRVRRRNCPASQSNTATPAE